MTLIEVLASLMLLGTLAVAMVLSRGRLVDQHQRAEAKLEAVRLAENLLAQWWADGAGAVPIGESGPLESHAGWSWETDRVLSDDLDAFDAQVVRLRILENAGDAQSVELTSVDLVLPNMEAP